MVQCDGCGQTGDDTEIPTFDLPDGKKALCGECYPFYAPSSERLQQETMIEKAIQLWLSGATYRQAIKATGLTTGRFSRAIAELRSANPDLNSLRELNKKIEDSGTNIPDLIRASNLDFDLAVMDAELKKKTSKITAAKVSMDTLTLERETLNEEIKKIKDVFSAQGLSWKEGLKIVKDVKDLKDQSELWTNGVAVAKSDYEEEEKKIVKAKKEVLRIQKIGERFETSNEQLRKTNKYLVRLNGDLEKKFKDNYESLQNSWRYKEDIESSNKKLTTEHNQLQEKNAVMKKRDRLLEQRWVELSKTVKDLEARKGSLEKECKNMIKTTKERTDKIDADCLKNFKIMNEKSEARENQILSGVTAKKEAIQKEVEVLEAEKELLEVGMTPLLDQIHAEQDKLRAEREKAHKGENPPAENFLQRLPDFEA